MRRLRGWVRRLGGLFDKPRRDRDLDEELESHLRLHTEDGLREGLTPTEARRRAMVQLGGLDATKEACRDQRGLPWLETLWRDVRYGVRQLRKNPGFTVVAVLTLALGIGANTAIFSVVNAVFLVGLPYHEPERLALIWSGNPGNREFPPINADVAAWRERTQSFAQVAAFTPQTAELAELADPERLGGVAVTPEFFRTLGVEPFLGRAFTPEEGHPGAARVGLISHSLWERRFGADPGLIGRAITVNGNPLMIIGIMPPGFDFPRGAELPALFPFANRTDIWLPLKWDAARWQSRLNRELVVLGRLRPGVTLRQGQAELEAYAARQAKESPNYHDGWTLHLVSLPHQVAGKSRTALLLLFAASGLLLLIACINVAHLLLARGVTRTRELAIRAALGAGRARVVGQLLTESVLLSVLGGGFGLLFAQWCIDLLLSLRPDGLSRLEHVSLNPVVLGFAALMALLTGVVFGLIPAFGMSKANLRDSLNESGRGTENAARHAVRDWLMAGEVALAVVLLLGASLLGRSLLKIQAVDPGFRAPSVLTFDVSLPSSRYADESRRNAFYRQFVARLEALPDVLAAGAISWLPLGGGENFAMFEVEGTPVTPGHEPVAQRRVVTPGYFAAMGIATQGGRTFTARDEANQPAVVVINETMARLFFGQMPAVGQRLRLGPANSNDVWRTIVGVVRDVKSHTLEAQALPQLYLPLEQWPRSEMSFVLKGESDPLPLVAAIRAEAKALDPQLPLAKVRTMEQVVATATSARRFNAVLMGFFAVTALLLTLTGLYGVITWFVGRRTREIGIRMALGATRGTVLRLILTHGMKPVGLGCAIGLLVSLALARLMKTLLFGVTPTDPLTFALIAPLLLSVAFLACWLPARRAARVDPMVALRSE